MFKIKNDRMYQIFQNKKLVAKLACFDIDHVAVMLFPERRLIVTNTEDVEYLIQNSTSSPIQYPVTIEEIKAVK